MTTAKYISDIIFDNCLDKKSYLNELPVIKFLAKEKQLSFSSNVTFFVGENGLEDHFCDKIVLQRCKYSQCQIGYELQMYRGNENKCITRQFLTKPLFVLTKCNLKMPESVLYNIKDKDGMIIKKSRFSMHSLDILGAVSTWIIQSGFDFENM